MDSNFFKQQLEELAKQADERTKKIEDLNKQLLSLNRERDEYVGAYKFSIQLYQEKVKQEEQQKDLGKEAKEIELNPSSLI